MRCRLPGFGLVLAVSGTLLHVAIRQSAAQCPKGSATADLHHCERFSLCGARGAKYNFTCAQGLYFDVKKTKCRPPQYVNCTGRGGYRFYNETRLYQPGSFWGPALPKDRCRRLYCTISLRQEGRAFSARQLDPRICTDIMVDNFRLSRETTELFASNNNTTWLVNEIKKLVTIREVYPGVRVHAVLGRQDDARAMTSLLKSNRRKRALFARSTASLLRRHSLAGLHLHVTVPDDSSRFQRRLRSLVSSVSKWFRKEASKYSKLSRLTLGLSVPADRRKIKLGFKPSSLSGVDTVFLMTDAVSAHWSVSAEGVATRFPMDKWSVDRAVRKWEMYGVNADKIVLDVALKLTRHYLSPGRAETSKPFSSNCGKPAGPRAVDLVYGPGYSLATVRGKDIGQFVEFREDEQSLSQKVSFVASYGLGGLHVTDLADDDLEGACTKATEHHGKQRIKFPLASAAVKACSASELDLATLLDMLEQDRPPTPGRISRGRTGCKILFCRFWREFKTRSSTTTPEVRDIDATYCTHLSFGHFFIGSVGTEPVSIHPSALEDYETIKKMSKLKRDFPHLLLMLGIKDNDFQSTNIENISRSDENVDRFSFETTALLRRLNLDGLDLDWRYPRFDGSRMANFMQRLHILYKREAEISGKPRLQLAATVYGNAYHVYKDLDIISNALDVFLLETAFQTFVLPATDKPRNVSDKNIYRRFNPPIDRAWQHMKASNVDKDKVAISLELGVRVYGYSQVGSQLNLKTREKLPFTQTPGSGAYYELCQLRRRPDVREHFFPDRLAQWVTYQESGHDRLVIFQDESALRAKIQYVLQQGFAGGFIRNIAADDFTGDECRVGPFPLLSAIGGGCLAFQRRADTTLSPTAIVGKELAAVPTVGCDRVVCYYNDQARQRRGAGMMQPMDIDASQCTHLVFSHAVHSDRSILPLLPDDKGKNGAYAEFARLKKANPALKTLLSVRGPRDKESAWKLLSGVLLSGSGMQAFALNAYNYVTENEFDGLELDFSGDDHGAQNITQQHRAGFSQLVEYLHDKFSGNDTSLLLAVKLPGERELIRRLYDVRQISASVDWLSANTYSWYDWQKNVYHYSPVFRRYSGLHAASTVNKTLEAFVSQLLGWGAPPAKLLVGIGLYGRAFTLTKRDFWKPGDESSSVGHKFNYSQEYGILTAYETCDLQRKGGTARLIEEQLVPYMVYDDQWIGFENERSVRQKVRFSKLYGLGGVAVWSLDADDFGGRFCGPTPFPLLGAIRKECSVVGEAAAELSRAVGSEELLKARFDMKRVCYVSADSFTRNKPAKFDVTYVPVGLCSHFVLDAFKFTDDGDVQGIEPRTLNAIRTMKLLQQEDSHLKIVFSIKSNFHDVARSPAKRKRLFDSLVLLMRSQNIYNVDVQWTDIQSRDASLYSQFLISLNSTLHENAGKFNATPSLTLAVGKHPLQGFDYDEISDIFDAFHVFSFDFSHGWDTLAHNDLQEDFQQSINEYLQVGVPRDKLVAGISLHGKVYYLRDPALHNVSDPALRGPMGMTTKEPGRWTFYEVCYQMQADKHAGFALSGYDAAGRSVPRTSSAYFNDRLWASYDSRNKVQDKVAWVRNQSLAGYHLHTLDGDVFLETLCGFSVEGFPIALGAHLASRGLQQYESLVAASAPRPSSRLAVPPGLGAVGRLLGLPGGGGPAFVMTVTLGAVYYTAVSALLK